MEKTSSKNSHNRGGGGGGSGSVSPLILNSGIRWVWIWGLSICVVICAEMPRGVGGGGACRRWWHVWIWTTWKGWVKGTATLLAIQTCTGPVGSSCLRFPNFKTFGTRRWQGCHPYTPAALSTQEVFMVLISVKGPIHSDLNCAV